jgi:16S rRNA G966 N2-methylase RsmD
VTGERQRFDLIYADPPYAAGLYGPLAAAVRQGDWLQPEGQLLLECGTSQLPPLPEDWELLDQRRYGSTTLIRLKLLVQD